MPAAPKMWTVDHLGLLSHQKQNLSDTARNRSHIRMLLIASAPYRESGYARSFGHGQVLGVSLLPQGR